jgi:hypothetical protein
MIITAGDIVLKALLFINAYSPGEPLDSSDSDDALSMLNLLTESRSTTRSAVFASDDNVFTFTPGQYVYSVGNYDAGTFPGTVTSASATITGASIPADMKIGGDIVGSGIPAGTTILAFNAGAGTVTMSALGTVSPGAQQIAYTIPGDFKMNRPLRITQAYTRLTTSGSSLDYPMEIIDQSRYVNIGYKGIPAPWPIYVWYNPTFPLGQLNFYQNPSSAGQLHLYSDEILQAFPDLTTRLVMPQGYALMLVRLLGRELAPEYGSIWTPMKEKLTDEAVKRVEALNATPSPVANYDPELYQSRATDAGWILNGGFR